MPGFATYDQIINALTTGKGQLLFFQKASITSVAAFWYRLWNAAGSPGAGSDPTGLQGTVCTRTTVGALVQNNPVSPATLHMLSLGAGGGTLGSLMLYDRLWHVGGISLNSTSVQTILAPQGPDRHSDGINNQILIEITTAGGATACTVTVSYTNENDVAGRSATVSLPASIPVNRCMFLNLQAGDRGVKSIQTVQCSAAMGAGVANLVLLNGVEIVVIPWVANQWTERDLVLQMANLPRVLDNACLALMVLPSTTSTGIIYGRLQLAEN